MFSAEFFRGGKCYFTVTKLADGKHYTFRIVRKEATEQYPEVYWMGVLTGPDNTSMYSYLGVFEPSDLSLRMTAKSKFAEDSVPVRLARYILNHAHEGKELPAGYALNHDGRCCRCRKLLTVRESVESGIGPECAKIMGGRRTKAKTDQKDEGERHTELAATMTATECESEDSTVSTAFWASSGISVKGLTAVKNADNEVTHWTGLRNGVKITVFND